MEYFNQVKQLHMGYTHVKCSSNEQQLHVFAH